MRYINLSLVFVLILSLNSCSPFHKSDLNGHWQSVEVLEEGIILEVNTDEITLTFDENDNYTYTSTLKYKEKGTYYIQKDLLYTTDTINENSMPNSSK